MASNANATDRTAALLTVMKNLDPAIYQAIREDYFRIADNLKPLADALEKADAEQPETAGPLLDEHYIFIQIYDLLRESQLGAVV